MNIISFEMNSWLAYNGFLYRQKRSLETWTMYMAQVVVSFAFWKRDWEKSLSQSHIIYSFKFHTSIINSFNTDINTKIAGFIVKGSQAIKLKPPPSTSSIHAFHSHFQPFDFDHPIWYFLFPRLVFFFFPKKLVS